MFIISTRTLKSKVYPLQEVLRNAPQNNDLCTVWVTELWHRLLREAAEPSSAEILKSCLNTVLCNMPVSGNLFEQEGWTRCSPEILSNLNCSVILWCRKFTFLQSNKCTTGFDVLTFEKVIGRKECIQEYHYKICYFTEADWKDKEFKMLLFFYIISR